MNSVRQCHHITFMFLTKGGLSAVSFTKCFKYFLMVLEQLHLRGDLQGGKRKQDCVGAHENIHHSEIIIIYQPSPAVQHNLFKSVLGHYRLGSPLIVEP